MSVADDLAAIRATTTLRAGDELACVRIDGAGAHELLDRVSPRQLFVRSGQMLHTLFLDDAAKPVADVYLCCDDDAYHVVAEGMRAASVLAYLADHAHGLSVELVDLSLSHAFLCLDGPYAWELLAEISSPDVIGLPYLGFFHDPRFTCFRGGKTGEYGYDLLVAREQLAAERARILDLGRRFELREIGQEAHALAMLESAFFDVRRAPRPGLTPVELQLQWRLNAGRDYPGSAAITARRASPRGRTVLAAAASELVVDAAIELDGSVVGTVLVSGQSHTRGDWLALALLEPGLAHAGLHGFTCGGIALRTISSPAINNRSLYVDPQRHSWATRESNAFPPLVRPDWS
ncbi:MAG TPA: hypothetical protein VMJ10_30500 [Kofleriaceae bacterium]|nr:hypothetical protein [Kofleriaceae bacterium]